MILSKDEAVCLVLNLSRNKEISSPTKLNKLLARLNLHFIPIDVEFELNKYGSFKADILQLSETELYGIQEYKLPSGPSKKFFLKAKGEEKFIQIIKPKLDKIMHPEDFRKLKEEIEYLSSLRAEEISENEHNKLLLDVDSRYKLLSKVNIVTVDFFDLYEESKKITKDDFVTVKLKGLIEYCYNLARYLKEIKFKRLSEEYDFGAYMFDYYFVYNLEVIHPFLKEQISAEKKDEININKYYQFIINSVKDYPFSLDNPNLKDLIVS